jgi:hypothetical protein
VVVSAATSRFYLHGRNTHYAWAGALDLSIKTFTAGQARYEVAGAQYAVDDSSYLIVNARQPYRITIEAPQPVESFCLFFPPDYVSDAWRLHRTPQTRLLDMPARDATPPNFYERTYPHDDLVTPVLRHIQATIQDQAVVDPLWLDEQLYQVLCGVFVAHQQITREVNTPNISCEQRSCR